MRHPATEPPQPGVGAYYLLTVSVKVRAPENGLKTDPAQAIACLGPLLWHCATLVFYELTPSGGDAEYAQLGPSGIRWQQVEANPQEVTFTTRLLVRARTKRDQVQSAVFQWQALPRVMNWVTQFYATATEVPAAGPDSTRPLPTV